MTVNKPAAGSPHWDVPLNAALDQLDAQHTAHLNDGTSHGGVDLTFAAGKGPVVRDTVTGTLYRLRVVNGVISAVPASLLAPSAPTGLVADPRVSSVALTWATQATPVDTYTVYRDGSPIASLTGVLTYIDYSVITETTYSYQVSGTNLVSEGPRSTAVPATPSAIYNVAPTVPLIDVYPNPVPTDGTAIVRINALDADGQLLTYGLSADVGTLTATADPATWIYTP